MPTTDKERELGQQAREARQESDRTGDRFVEDLTRVLGHLAPTAWPSGITLDGIDQLLRQLRADEYEAGFATGYASGYRVGRRDGRREGPR